jgi:hypothetical protein
MDDIAEDHFMGLGDDFDLDENADEEFPDEDTNSNDDEEAHEDDRAAAEPAEPSWVKHLSSSDGFLPNYSLHMKSQEFRKAAADARDLPNRVCRTLDAMKDIGIDPATFMRVISGVDKEFTTLEYNNFAQQRASFIAHPDFIPTMQEMLA